MYIYIYVYIYIICIYACASHELHGESLFEELLLGGKSPTHVLRRALEQSRGFTAAEPRGGVGGGHLREQMWLQFLGGWAG